MVKQNKNGYDIIREIKQVLFWYLRGKRMNYIKKGKEQVRSEDSSHIARPKQGHLPCQLVTKMLIDIDIHMILIFISIDIKYSRRVYSIIFH